MIVLMEGLEKSKFGPHDDGCMMHNPIYKYQCKCRLNKEAIKQKIDSICKEGRERGRLYSSEREYLYELENAIKYYTDYIFEIHDVEQVDSDTVLCYFTNRNRTYDRIVADFLDNIEP